jgi:cytochrome o ubiquinol oxidase subunit 2
MREARPDGRPRARTAGRLAAAAATLALASCRRDSVFTPVGWVGDQERLIFIDSMAIMLAIVIPTMLAVVAVAWWFRASNTRARRDFGFVYSGRLELIVWSIPALTILFLGGVAWIGSHDLDPAQPLTSEAAPLDVDVVAMDWKWLFIYPGQNVATINRLVTPVGTPLRIHLTSATVMNTLFAPEIGSQLYAMNGMVGTLWWRADRPGVFPGRSNMFSGDGFSGMAFEIDAVTPSQFAAWSAAAHGADPALDETAYRGLLRQSSHVRPYAYGSVQPGLFDAVVLRKLPPGEGPTAGRPGPQVKPVSDE